MSNIGNSNQNLPQDPYQGADGALYGLIGLGGLAVAAFSVSSVFAASIIAGAATLVALGSFALVFFLCRRAAQPPRLSLVFLATGAIWTACVGFIVFDNHWLAFTPAAWVMNILFVAALATGAWAKLKGWARLLAALASAALVTATVVLPRPPGGDGAMDTAEKWRVEVDVSDSADSSPLAGARVLCATVMQWQGALELEDASARTTGRDGRTEAWEFEDDPRLKIVVCNAWKDADDGNAGYPVATQIVAAPSGGGGYRLQFGLQENAHPDVSFLALDLSGTFVNHNWFYLDFELWAGAPQGAMGARDGPQPLGRKSYRELNGGFRMPAHEAASAMTLRYRYEGPASGDGLTPPYSEVHEMTVEPIAQGSRRTVPLTIPAGQRD